MLGAPTVTAQEIEREAFVCFGRNNQGPLVETLTAVQSGPNAIEFISEGEAPDTWGLMFFGYDSVLPPAQAALTPSPVCITGPLVRSAPYQSNFVGVASITVTDMFPAGTTFFAQRAHRSVATPVTPNGVGSGMALKIKVAN